MDLAQIASRVGITADHQGRPAEAGRMSRKRIPSNKFGWCLDGLHDACRAEATTRDGVHLVCGCECHKA
jgi:hypothetical protein